MEKLFKIFNDSATKEEFVNRMAAQIKNNPQLELATIMMYYNSIKK